MEYQKESLLDMKKGTALLLLKSEISRQESAAAACRLLEQRVREYNRNEHGFRLDELDLNLSGSVYDTIRKLPGYNPATVEPLMERAISYSRNQIIYANEKRAAKARGTSQTIKEDHINIDIFDGLDKDYTEEAIESTYKVNNAVSAVLAANKYIKAIKQELRTSNISLDYDQLERKLSQKSGFKASMMNIVEGYMAYKKKHLEKNSEKNMKATVPVKTEAQADLHSIIVDAGLYLEAVNAASEKSRKTASVKEKEVPADFPSIIVDADLYRKGKSQPESKYVIKPGFLQRARTYVAMAAVAAASLGFMAKGLHDIGTKKTLEQNLAASSLAVDAPIQLNITTSNYTENDHLQDLNGITFPEEETAVERCEKECIFHYDKESFAVLTIKKGNTPIGLAKKLGGTAKDWKNLEVCRKGDKDFRSITDYLKHRSFWPGDEVQLR